MLNDRIRYPGSRPGARKDGFLWRSMGPRLRGDDGEPSGAAVYAAAG